MPARFFVALFAFLAFSHAGLAQNARDIIVRSLHTDLESLSVASKYTYLENTVTRELDSSGTVKKTTSETREILFLGGKRYEHLIQKDGKPLPPDEARKEQAKFDKAASEASKLTEAQRDERYAAWERERAKQRESFKSIPDAYDFTLLGQPSLAGRPCFLIQAQPRSSYHGKHSNFLSRIDGKIWIDQSDYQWVRVESQVLDDVTFGLFLLKMSGGSRFTLERTRVNNEVWLPKKLTLNFSGRALIKHVNLEQVITYSDYRKYSSSSRIVAEPELTK
jgi:negative regulator of sigma E activity